MGAEIGASKSHGRSTTAGRDAHYSAAGVMPQVGSPHVLEAPEADGTWREIVGAEPGEAVNLPAVTRGRAGRGGAPQVLHLLQQPWFFGSLATIALALAAVSAALVRRYVAKRAFDQFEALRRDRQADAVHLIALTQALSRSASTPVENPTQTDTTAGTLPKSARPRSRRAATG
jgi:hypothetical protein